MQFEIRNAADGPSDAIRKDIAAGRTVLSLKGGERMEIVDPATGRIPAGLKVRRGGSNGKDLIVDAADEVLELQGFFDMDAEGDQAVTLRLPGAESEEITPASPEVDFGFAGEYGGSAVPVVDGGDALLAPMQAGNGAAAAGGTGHASSASSVAGTSAGAAGSNLGWWVLAGVGGAAVLHSALDDDDPPPPAPEPTLTLARSAAEVDEGQTVTFTLTTTHIAPGTQYTYTLSGVSASDVQGGSLSGTVTIGPDGKALIPVTLVADAALEGAETLTVSVAGQSASVTINDTSVPPVQTFALDVVGDVDAVNEGQTVKFVLKTENVPAGQKYTYTLGGDVSAADVVGGKLSGEVTIDANGEAVIEVTIAADAALDGHEELTVSVAGQSASVTINDTSVPPVQTFALDVVGDVDAVNEGQTVKFVLKTENVPAGQKYTYTLGGDVSAADVVGGNLSGEVTIDANGEAVIEVKIAEDAVTDVGETLTVSVAGQTASVDIVDTTPTFQLSAPEEANEGDTITFVLATTNVPAGTQYAYTITGLEAEDVEGGSLSGVATVGADGTAVITVTVVADEGTEGHEPLTLTVAGKSATVLVKDSSIQQTFDLTSGDDRVVGSDGNDVFRATGMALGAGDNLDGGEGDDTLNLMIYGGVRSEGATVSNIETLNIEPILNQGSSDPAVLRMTHFSGVDAINITDGTANLELRDQQSIVDVTITDTTSDVLLDYDTQAVSGAEDKLDVTIDEFGTERAGSAMATLAVDDGIESLDINVADGKERSSKVNLIADGVTDLTIDGGQEGQKASFEVSVNKDREEGGSLDATDFEGDLDLTINRGGREKFVYDIEITQGLKSNEIAEIEINDKTISYKHAGSPVEASTVAAALAEAITTSLSGVGAVAEGGVLRLYVDFDAAGLIEVVVNGVSMTNVSLNEELTRIRHSALEQVTLGNGEHSVEVSRGDITHDSTYSLGDGASTLKVADDVHGNVTMGSGDTQVLEVGDDIGGAAKVSLAGDENVVDVGGDVHGFANVALTGTDNTLTVGGDVGGFAEITVEAPDQGDSENGVTVAGSIKDQAALSFGPGYTDLTAKGIAGNATLDFRGDADVSVGVDGIAGDKASDGVSVSIAGDGVLAVENEGMSDAAIAIEGDGEIVVTGDVSRASIDVGGDADVYVDGDVAETTIYVDETASITVDNGSLTGSEINVGKTADIVIGSDSEGGSVSSSIITVGENLADDEESPDFGSFAVDDEPLSTVTTTGKLLNSQISVVQGSAEIAIGGEAAGSTISVVEGTAEVSVASHVQSSTIDVNDATAIVANGDLNSESKIVVRGSAGTISIGGEVSSAEILVAGAADRVAVGEDVSSSTIEVKGATEVDIKGNVSDGSITLGTDTDDKTTFSIGGNVEGSTITVNGDSGEDSDGELVYSELRGTVGLGTAIQFAEANDNLLVDVSAGFDDRLVVISGEADESVVDMGGGSDAVVVAVEGVRADNTDASVVVGSGGALHGGSGSGDALTVASLDSVNVVERTEHQRITITLNATRTYAVDEEVEVVIGGHSVIYVVRPEDIHQGDNAATAANVANGLKAAIEASADAMGVLGSETPVGIDGTTIELTGEENAADITVTSASPEIATVVVEQYSNAEVSGFETLTLVAIQNEHVGVDAGESGQLDTAPVLGADFALIDGVNKINLTSEVDLRGETTGTGEGQYSTFEEGYATVFELKNLPSNLAQPITVTGKEASATGNLRVMEINIADSGDGILNRTVGSEVALIIGGERIGLEITAAHLVAGDATKDAEAIAKALAEAINDGTEHYTAAWVGGSTVRLISTSHENVSVRFDGTWWWGQDNEFGDDIDLVQRATAPDDDEIDVYVHASPAVEGGEDTLWFAVGTGESDASSAFDLAILGAGSPAFDKLQLDILDAHSHYIAVDGGHGEEAPLGADGEHRAFRQSITLTGGVEGATITLDGVVAKEVDAGETDANLRITFHEAAQEIHNPEDVLLTGDEAFGFTVRTSGGDDIVDMRHLVLTNHAKIDLGDGEDDRLIIANGNVGAGEALDEQKITDAEEITHDEIFQNVTGVEVLEFVGDEPEEFVFSGHARDAGFQRFEMAAGSDVSVTVLGQFVDRLDIAVTGTGDDARLIGTFEHDGGATITAGDDFFAAITVTEHSLGDLTIEGDRNAEIFVNQHGTGHVDVKTGWRASVDVDHFNATGDVDVTVGGRSSVVVDYGEASGPHDGELSIVQMASFRNEIELKDLSDEQDVSVSITLFGDGKDTTIKQADDKPGWSAETRYDTHLRVVGEDGGIDQLTVQSAAGDQSGNVSILVDDLWATEGEGDAADIDLTIDASQVALGENGVVLIDARDETDANLKLVGSETAANQLLGGARSDVLIGGDSSDYLYGGSDDFWVRSITLDFGDFSQEQPRRFGLYFSEEGSAGVTMTVGWGAAGYDGDELVSAFVQWLEAGTPEGTTDIDAFRFIENPGGPKLIDVLNQDGGWVAEGDTLTLFLRGPDVAPTPSFGTTFVDWNGGVYNGDDKPVAWTTEYSALNAQADTLEGGAGSDVYVVDGGDFDTMDTIVGLDLNADDGDGDKIFFGGLEGNNYDPISTLNVEEIVWNGAIFDLPGDGEGSLADAVHVLFQSGGLFSHEGVGATATNAAGLFRHGDDTYLIAVGDEATGEFGRDDIIVRLDGVTGTLTLDDFWVPMPG